MADVQTIEALAKTAGEMEDTLRKCSTYIGQANKEMGKLKNELQNKDISEKFDAYKKAFDGMKKKQQELLKALNDGPKELAKVNTDLSKNIEEILKEKQDEEDDRLSGIEANLMTIGQIVNQLPKGAGNAVQPIAAVPPTAYPAQTAPPVSSDIPQEYQHPTSDDYSLLKEQYDASFGEILDFRPELSAYFREIIEEAFFNGGFNYFETNALKLLLCKVINSNPKDLRKFLNELASNDEEKEFEDEDVPPEEYVDVPPQENEDEEFPVDEIPF